jgi:hypothetical protein
MFKKKLSDDKPLRDCQSVVKYSLIRHIYRDHCTSPGNKPRCLESFLVSILS